MDNKNKKKVKKYHWLIILGITVITTMWIYGMTQVYMPTPIDIGFGQYIDLGTGVVILSLLLLGFILGTLFKKKGGKKIGKN